MLFSPGLEPPELEKRLRAPKKAPEFIDLEPTLTELKSRMTEKILSEISSLSNPIFLSNSMEKKKKYAEELKLQMEEKKQKDLKEKLQRKIGLSNDLNGYPSFPIIPIKEASEKELFDKKIFRKALDSQVRTKKLITTKEKNKETEIGISFNNFAAESLKNEKFLKELNKNKQNDILIRTWSQGKKIKNYKDIEEKIIRKGCNFSVLKALVDKKLEDEEIVNYYSQKLKIVKNKEDSKENWKIESLPNETQKKTVEQKPEEKTRKSKSFCCFTEYGVLKLKRYPPYPKPLAKVALRALYKPYW